MNRKRVGIVGAGQLGRMLALAGYPLGIECRVLDTTADAPGAQVAPAVLGRLDDARALAELASQVDVVTLEIENVAVAPLEAPEHCGRDLRPGRIGRGVEHAAFDTEWITREREHAAELTGADDANPLPVHGP